VERTTFTTCGIECEVSAAAVGLLVDSKKVKKVKPAGFAAAGRLDPGPPCSSGCRGS